MKNCKLAAIHPDTPGLPYAVWFGRLPSAALTDAAALQQLRRNQAEAERQEIERQKSRKKGTTR